MRYGLKVGFVAFNAVAGWVGVVGLVGGGADFGEPIDSRLPFHSLGFAGLALMVWVALPMTAAAIALGCRSDRAPQLCMAAGAAEITWIAIEVVVIRTFAWLQPVCVAMGLIVYLIGSRSALARQDEPAAPAEEVHGLGRGLGR